MAQSYTRQSTFADGDTITAALFNDEYNQLLNAFAYSNTSAASTGHRHDGTAGEGGNIHTIGDLDFNNKIVVDSTNNRWGFYVEVSSAAVEQIRIQDGAMLPVTDSDVDLGTSSLYWKDAYIDSVTTTGNISIGGNLTVTGNATISGNLTFGDADTDSITLTADVASSITPDTDDTYDLGSASKEWRDLYIDGTAYLDAINFNGTAITATAAELNYTDGVTSNIQTQLDAKQALDADLTAIAGLANTGGNFIVGNGTTWVVESGATARASLGLTISSDVLAYDANLQSFVTAFTLPTTDGTSGQALITNGSGTIAFGDVDALPTQTGNSGYYLTTDGTNASWDNLKASPTFTGTVTISSTDALTLPVGTTAQRPTAVQGMVRYNTTTSGFEGYNGSAWGALGAEFAYTRTSATATASQTTFSATYTAGYVDVYLNGVKLVSGTDFTATNGTSVVLTTGATVGDNVEILAYETFSVANALVAANNLSDLSSASIARTNLGLVIGTDVQAYDAQLADVAGLTPTDGNFIVGDGTNFVTESGATAIASLGITATVSELNILDGVTATTAELNILDGVTATTAELNILDGVTSTATEINLLDGVTATTAEINYLDVTTLGTTEASKAVTADANGVVTFDNGISEEYTAVTSSSNATTVNLRDGTNFSHTLTENTTFTFSNPASSGKVSAFTLKIVQDASASGYTVTWPASVDWPSATAPTLTATASAVDYFVFITHDGGTTYYGFTAGQALG